MHDKLDVKLLIRAGQFPAAVPTNGTIAVECTTPSVCKKHEGAEDADTLPVMEESRTPVQPYAELARGEPEIAIGFGEMNHTE